MDTPDGGAFPDDFVEYLYTQIAQQRLLLINKQWTLAALRPVRDLQRHEPDWNSLKNKVASQNNELERTDHLWPAWDCSGKAHQ